jgi:2-polyprenyl-6-hydroxyphenyl methylase / 3-demethylubiquinone-9 3-methyltransferase
LINVDPYEIEKFEKVSDRWWDLSGEMKSLHDINPLRLEYIRSWRSLDGLNVLDVGCGGGILSEALALSGAHVTGIDMAFSPLKSAKAHLKVSGLNINYQQSTVENWAKKFPETYDVITCMELIEHVPDPRSVILSCARLIKPDGDIFFATINRTLKAFIYAIIGAEYILKILPRKTHQYARFIKPSEINQWALEAGLTQKDFTGMHYNLITKNYWLGGDLSVNYLMRFSKTI